MMQSSTNVTLLFASYANKSTEHVIEPVIITIIVVSIVSGVALIGVGYIYFKKRKNPDRISE